MPRTSRAVWFVIAGLIAGGVGLLGVAAAVHLPRFLGVFVPGLGTALLVAGILAATIDRSLKKRLLQDAFETLFGYMLPEELRAELNWLSRQELFCDQFSLTLTLREIADSDLVAVRIEQTREMHNISSRTVGFEPLFALDEWFHEGHPSRVLDIRVTHRDTTHDDMQITRNGFVVTGRLPKVRLRPRERLTFVASGEETRHRSDAWFLNLIWATASPRVTVNAPEEIGWETMFGFSREAGGVRPLAATMRELPATLLPGQIIQVRWWPKEGSNA